MSYFHRSILSIQRRKSRSLILFLAVALLCNVMAGAISVKNALLNTEKSFTDLIPITVRIEDDYSIFLDNSSKKVTEEIVNEIGKSAYVKNYYYYYEYTLGSKKLENGRNDLIVGAGEDFHPFNLFSIVGVYQTNILEIENGLLSLKEGKLFTKEEIQNGKKVILISKELAKKNNLKVGDKIGLSGEVNQYSSNPTFVEEEYTIVGILEAKKEYERNSNGEIVEKENEYADTIYMPNNAIKEIHEEVLNEIERQNTEDYDSFTLVSNFELNDINELEYFKSENLTKLPKGYTFVDNSSSIENVVTPMKNMEDLANIIVYASIFASIIIIGLISVLFCKERKKEMGIYLALGERKKNIALQILLETLIISVVAVTLSTFTGNLLAKNISQKMLQNQIAEQNEKIQNQNYNQEETLDEEEILQKYDVSLNLETILLIYIVALTSITLSVTLPIHYTLKLNPRKILM